MLRTEIQRAFDADRPRDPDGRAFPPLLDPGAARRGTARERRPPVRVNSSPSACSPSATARALRPHRRVLRPPRRLAVVRPQRGARTALPVPRLEVRRHRPVRRGAVGARRKPASARTSSSSPTRWSKIGDVLWTYMGDPAQQPPLPEFEFAQVPPEQTYTSKRWQECNWLQALEGGIDSSHVSFLHSGGLKSDPLFKGAKGNEYNMNDLKPFFEVADSDGGLLIGARRNAEEGHYYWRITPWVMPNFTMVPPRGDHPIHGHFWVPIDDENCWAWSFDYHPVRALTDDRAAGDERRQRRPRRGTSPAPTGRWPNKDNDYLMDREAQRRGQHLLRRRRHRHAGRLAAGEHGPDRRPHQGEAGADRQRHHQGAAEAAQGGHGAARRGRDAARRGPRPPAGCGRRRSCCRRPSRSWTPAATRSPPPPACRSLGLMPVMYATSECARAASAAESRYRDHGADRPGPGGPGHRPGRARPPTVVRRLAGAGVGQRPVLHLRAPVRSAGAGAAGARRRRLRTARRADDHRRGGRRGDRGRRAGARRADRTGLQRGRHHDRGRGARRRVRGDARSPRCARTPGCCCCPPTRATCPNCSPRCGSDPPGRAAPSTANRGRRRRHGRQDHPRTLQRMKATVARSSASWPGTTRWPASRTARRRHRLGWRHGRRQSLGPRQPVGGHARRDGGRGQAVRRGVRARW